jgi:hypothetical protein
MRGEIQKSQSGVGGYVHSVPEYTLKNKNKKIKKNYIGLPNYLYICIIK